MPRYSTERKASVLKKLLPEIGFALGGHVDLLIVKNQEHTRKERSLLDGVYGTLTEE